MRPSRPLHRSLRSRSGAAIIIVMAFLAIVSILLLCNSSVVSGLKDELKLLEEKQQKKFAPEAAARGPGGATETTAPAK